jgi:hypothetical protein
MGQVARNLSMNSPATPNQAIQRTAGRSAFSLSMTSPFNLPEFENKKPQELPITATLAPVCASAAKISKPQRRAQAICRAKHRG